MNPCLHAENVTSYPLDDGTELENVPPGTAAFSFSFWLGRLELNQHFLSQSQTSLPLDDFPSWRPQGESNPHPHADNVPCNPLHYGAISQRRRVPRPYRLCWWTRGDSNPQPPRCKRGALPLSYGALLALRGSFELPTPCSSDRCSTSELPKHGAERES